MEGGMGKEVRGGRYGEGGTGREVRGGRYRALLRLRYSAVKIVPCRRIEEVIMNHGAFMSGYQHVQL